MMFVQPSASPALYDTGAGSWRTYQQLAGDVTQTADCLFEGAKRLVFCFCRNDYDSVVGYLAGLEAGHVTALLDDRLPAPLRSQLIDHYKPEYILQSSASEWMLPASEWTAVESPGVRVSRSRETGVPILGQTALLLSTSGSTGTPKFVRLSRENLAANAASIAEALGIEAGQRAIASLPFHYSYGLSVLNTHLLTGATVVLSDEGITARPFWQTVRDLQCTSFAGVPYSYQLLDRLRLPGADFPSLATFTQAGGKLGVDLARKVHENVSRRGGRFFVMYGQTEATARIAILPNDCLPEKLGSAGRAIPGGSLTIDTGAGDGSGSGEIVYSGPNVMLGYATCREDLSKGDEQGSTLRTGDLGYLDADGFLFITGRLNRFAKLSGIRFNLDEVETMLKSYGPSAVISANEKLIVFCEGGQPDLLAQRRAEIARQLSVHFSLVEFRGILNLPVKSNGKIDYRTLEDLARC